jgi:hypothetical protein
MSVTGGALYVSKLTTNNSKLACIAIWLCQLKSAEVCYESEHFLPPRKKLTDSNTFRLDLNQLDSNQINLTSFFSRGQKVLRFITYVS